MSSLSEPSLNVGQRPPAPADKQQIARKSTFASIALNAALVVLQVVVGVFAHSQALVADGMHSLADLVSDFVVLVANRRSSAGPDADHNYGHSRYETVASLFLGGLLVAVGVGMVIRGGLRLADPGAIGPVHASALAVAFVVLVSKEALFRYMLREAQRARSAMLIANAWHARSDAASSLVVALGIVGNLAGVRLLDPIAAAIVGFMVARMGFTFGWDALQDLSDRALDDAATADLRAQLLATPGVRDVHDLRTRKTGDLALVDAHILVEPLISVSEGHYIAASARARLMQDARVLDALIHVDPEDDLHTRLPPDLPPRHAVRAQLEQVFAAHGIGLAAVTLHYLSTGLEIDVTLTGSHWEREGQEVQETREGREAQEARKTDIARALRGIDLDALKTRVGARRLDVLQSLQDNGNANGNADDRAPREGEPAQMLPATAEAVVKAAGMATAHG